MLESEGIKMNKVLQLTAVIERERRGLCLHLLPHRVRAAGRIYLYK